MATSDMTKYPDSQWHPEPCPRCGRSVKRRLSLEGTVYQAHHVCPHGLACGAYRPACSRCAATAASAEAGSQS
jgi:hypothetical protein